MCHYLTCLQDSVSLVCRAHMEARRRAFLQPRYAFTVMVACQHRLSGWMLLGCYTMRAHMQV